MKIKKTPVILAIQLSLATVVLTACGGGSSSSTPVDDDVTDGNGTSTSGDADSGDNGAGSDADSDQVGQVLLGRQYNNGYIADTGTTYSVSLDYSPPDSTYTIDTEGNVVGDGRTLNNIPEVFYDDEGRATEIQTSPSSAPFELAYNSNGTISSITQTNASSGTVETITFNYEGDKLVGKNTTRTSDGEVTPYGSIIYGYSTDGVIASAEVEKFVFGIRIEASYTFMTDASGRITEVVELDEDGSIDTRSQLTYDTYGNVVAEDTYLGDAGGLHEERRYTYKASPEQAVNIFGLFSDINDVFLPAFDL